MKIGIDGRSLTSDRAIFRYTKNLLNSLAQIDRENDYLLFIEGEGPLIDVKYLNLSANWRLVKAPNKLVLRDHLFFRRFIEPYCLDLVFHPDNTEFFWCHRNSIVTVHDLIPYLIPELSLSSNQLIKIKQKLYLHLQEKAFRKSCSQIITVSQNSKNDLINLFGFAEEKISVTYEGIEPTYRPSSKEAILRMRQRYGITGDYIFCHAGFSAYKNVQRLVEAFADFSNSFAGIPLVLGGAPMEKDSYFENLVKNIGKLSLGEKVIFTGFIPEEILPDVYSGAVCFVYPSLYEGFGIPPLEAQACGVPVLCSNTSSLPEVVGKSALLFDPENTQEITEGLARIVKDNEFKCRLIQEGFTNVKRFSWNKCAEETLKVFENVRKK